MRCLFHQAFSPRSPPPTAPLEPLPPSELSLPMSSTLVSSLHRRCRKAFQMRSQHKAPRKPHPLLLPPNNPRQPPKLPHPLLPHQGQGLLATAPEAAAPDSCGVKMLSWQKHGNGVNGMRSCHAEMVGSTQRSFRYRPCCAYIACMTQAREVCRMFKVPVMYANLCLI